MFIRICDMYIHATTPDFIFVFSVTLDDFSSFRGSGQRHEHSSTGGGSSWKQPGVVAGKPINHAESVWTQTEMEVEMVMILLMVQKYCKLTS